MHVNKTKTQELLNTFSRAADLGVLCFDTELNVVAFSPSKKIVNDFICLEMNQITTFLAERFSEKPGADQVLHTFFLETNLVCSVSMLVRDGCYSGAYATQPAFVRKPEQGEFDGMLDRLSPSMKERSTLWKVLLAVPVIPYDRMLSVGNLLNILAQTDPEEKPVGQVLRYHDGSAAENRQKPAAEEAEGDFSRSDRNQEYALYLRMKDSIQNGNINGIQSFMDEVRGGAALVSRLNPTDFLNGLKHEFSRICAMGACMAVDAGAPYDKVMELSDEFIRQAAKLSDINAVYSLLRTAMIAFTRAVSLNASASYSKPVRQVIEYISDHYSEKITLDRLAQHTKLSTYYLSNLIKKETGIMLADHINRVRIEQAKKLLRDTGLSILEIAQEVGYNYQNHFTSIFRRQTGFTPTEYKGLVGTEQSFRKNENLVSAAIPVALEQTYNKLSIFEGMYDVARIVDPTEKISWMINPENEIQFEPEVCHNYWNQSGQCRECVAMRAFSKNESVLKIKEQGDDMFLVIATPLEIGNRTYAIEILKRVTDQIFFDLKSDPAGKIYDYRDDGAEDDGQPTLYSQKHIIEKLTTHLKRNKAVGKQLTIILAVLEGGELHNTLMEEYVKLIKRSLRSDTDWVGRYIGNVLLIALDDVDESIANRIKTRIDQDYRIILEKMDRSGDVTVHHAVKTLPPDVADPSAFIRLAYTALYSEMSPALN